MSVNIFNSSAFLQMVEEEVMIRVQAEAEPIIQKAVAEYEKIVRRQIAQAIMTSIESNFHLETKESEVVFKVLHYGRKAASL